MIMNSKYPFFRYITGDSKIHLMNSKMKVISFLLMLLSILLINDYVSLCISFILLLFLMASSKIDIKAYISNIFVVWWIYLILFLVIFFTTLNIQLAILWGLKTILIITLFLVFTFTTSLSEIAWGFECTFIKLKNINIPVSKISLRIAMDIKFISTVFEESKEIRKSMAYRGVPYKKGGLKSLKKMIIPVISLSYKLSRRMAKIMHLRFYGNSKRRTNYHENKVTAFDKVLIFIPIVIIYITIWLGWC